MLGGFSPTQKDNRIKTCILSCKPNASSNVSHSRCFESIVHMDDSDAFNIDFSTHLMSHLLFDAKHT